jgi:hypothetical protein
MPIYVSTPLEDKNIGLQRTEIEVVARGSAIRAIHRMASCLLLGKLRYDMGFSLGGSSAGTVVEGGIVWEGSPLGAAAPGLSAPVVVDAIARLDTYN